MKKIIITLFWVLTTTLSIAATPFGGADSLKDASDLWQAMTKEKLVGANALYAKPYKGMPPHGAVLDTVSRDIDVNDHTGNLIIKRNYGGKDVSVEKVAKNPNTWLKAITVMFKREKGYDSDNKNWFWAKYKPNGEVLTNPKKMKLAGRVAKGTPKGCISCHKGAPGGDYIFYK